MYTVDRLESEVKQIALVFAGTLGLQNCVIRSVDPRGVNWLVLVEGMLTAESESASAEEKECVNTLIGEPFGIRIVVAGAAVLKHEWVGIQLS